MICKFCQAENPDGAVFCSACGKRIDGKVLCPKCGTANDEGAVYCVSCGGRLDGRLTCPVCGALLPEGAHFCSACGHGLDKTPEKAQTPDKAETSDEAPAGKTLSYWLKLAGGISLLVSAAFSLIFLFCLGLTTSVSTSELAAQTGETQLSIYDFFSKIYENIGLTMQSYPSGGEYIAASLYFNAAIGTLLSAGAIVAVPICVALAAVRFARAVKRKPTQTNYFAPATAAYAVFLCSACGLLSLYAAEATSASVTSSVVLSGATLAGLILGGVFFAAGCGLHIAAKGKGVLKDRTVTKSILSAIGSVCAIVLLIFAAQGSIAFVSKATAQFAVSVKMQSNIMLYMEDLGVAFYQTYIHSVAYIPSEHLVMALFSELFGLACIALTVCLMFLPWTRLGTKRASPSISTLVLSCVLLVCAAAELAMNILFANAYVDYMRMDPATVEASFAAPIVMLVFAAAFVTVSIVRLALTRKDAEKKTAAPEA